MQNNIIIEPNNPTWMSILRKWIMWIIVWLMLAFFIFIMYTVFSWVFSTALSSTMSENWWANPLLSLIIMIIWFFSAIIGNMIILIMYNLFFSNKYYDLWKMISLSLITNIFLFFSISIIYILFNKEPQTLLLILAFHIIFANFLSYIIIEIFTNPNYSGVHLIGWTIWISLTIIIFLVIYNLNSIWPSWDWAHILIIVPPILVYTILPVFHTIWEKLYYKFYETWNNFLYIPSIDEVLVDEDEIEDVNVEDINVDN